MFDLPLHPIAVHFPIVLGIFLPVVGLIFWWAIKKQWVPQKSWGLVVVFVFIFTVSSLIAAELGEDEEEHVEHIVAEDVIEEHEEAGELIPWVGGTLLLVSLAGLVVKNNDRVRLALVVLGFLAILPLGNAGHTGGELVYKYGAANAHLNKEKLLSIVSKMDKVPDHHEHDHDD